MTNSSQYEKRFGFTAYAETLNVRLAMIGFIAVLITELVTG
nr:chlorophyll A-B binding protein [cyanobacterium endosymbiont of Rhopalodia gibberula]